MFQLQDSSAIIKQFCFTVLFQLVGAKLMSKKKKKNIEREGIEIIIILINYTKFNKLLNQTIPQSVPKQSMRMIDCNIL